MKKTYLGILGPVVRSILSLTSSLRGQLIKCTAKASHVFSTKNIGIFEMLTFEILTRLTNDVVSFEQPGLGVILEVDKPCLIVESQGYFWDGPELFCEKTIRDRLNLF